MNIEIASVILEICNVSEPATTSGPGLLLARDAGKKSRGNPDRDRRKTSHVWYDGSSKQNGGGQASISQSHLGSDVLKRGGFML